MLKKPPIRPGGNEREKPGTRWKSHRPLKFSHPAVKFPAASTSSTPPIPSRHLGSLAAGLDPDLVYIEDVAGAHKKGRVTTLFEDPLALAPHKLDDFDALVCCGPSPMLQALQKFSANLNKVCYLGLEEKMACGLGLCFSCSVKTDVGMQRCCLEGPWFNSKSLLNHFEFRQGLLPK